ncbi:acyl-CoA dehydrogenase family protein [Petropleomorpha daqingensis]|uniref:Alkylation response protein AidB-like acyl-CoA dehydrogenase n=1 Tax=Petropleomorpha daqingensis TaxID=2026353 RepID=A0A853CLT7_9ACTN|nr:acyl-CoA dehydrogenase family protein [Petropleomorpha daqingensis]NYJ08710.1 alkylation response protein AidB-like acyl-CoA dehydrogenase [Petropleomorpha daqingensis]
MEFTWTPEQQDLRASTRRLLQQRAPLARARELAEAGTRHDPQLWTAMAQQIGLQGLALPEDHGGSGGSLVELAVVLDEMGRVLLGGPFLPTALAAEALVASGDDAAAGEHLPAIAEGERTATLAVAGPDGRWGAGNRTARGSGGDVRLTGTAELVLDGADADLVLVAAQGERGPSLYAVEPAADGLTAQRLDPLDLTRPLARLHLSDTPARLVGEDGGAGEVLERVRRTASILLAAEQVGAMSTLVDLTAEHARTRRAFGRPIGAFQGVKHRLADMAVRLEMSRSAAYWAAWQPPGSPEAALGAAVAGSYCSESFLQTAKDTIQLHGGTGFTWEHDAHLFLRRARADATLAGSPAEHRAALVPLVLPELAEVPA